MIDQAKGMVMAAQQIDAEHAFAVLVARSQHENVKLRDIAEQIVARGSGAAEREGTAG